MFSRVRTIREWTKEFPAEQMAALREFSPISSVIPWIYPRWFSIRRPDGEGFYQERGRFVLYECVPEHLIPERDLDILNYLKGPLPSQLPDPWRTTRKEWANDWQVELYRTHKVWARNFWIIQGENGGHPVEYTKTEQDILQRKGLDTRPPAVGDLPFAPFDNRVIRQLIARNRLFQLDNNIAALRKSGSPEAMALEESENAKLVRAEHVRQLEAQMAPCVDFLAWYTTSAKTATECRETLPETSRQNADAAAQMKERYIDTGDVPVAA